METIKVFKVLTRNDTGETNSHQSGITIPKEISKTKIFPNLGIDKLNPREEIIFYDENNKMWKFQYIYYNDLFWGKEKSKGHDEHRLTCVKVYIKENHIKAGDTISFSIDDENVRHVGFKRKQLDDELENDKNQFVIKLGNGWHYITIKRGGENGRR